MYKSPIEIMLTEMQVKMENGIMKAVRDVGVNVDATELLKALAYDREQYKKGFADGQEAGHEWISVEERMPETQDKVILALRNECGEIRIAIGYRAHWTPFRYYIDGGNCAVDADRVTHWMPLPEPPKEE